MTRIADGILCETKWKGANVSAISTNDGTVQVDSPMSSRDTRIWKELIVRLGVGRMFSRLVESQDKKRHE